MQPSDLDLFTTEELLDELMSRSTFQGVVIHSEDEFKGQTWQGERVFRVRLNSNLNAAEAGRLLEAIAGHLDRSYE